MKKLEINEVNRIKSLMLIKENTGTIIKDFLLSLFAKTGDDYNAQLIKNMSDDELETFITRKITALGADAAEADIFAKTFRQYADEILTALKAGKSTSDDLVNSNALGIGFGSSQRKQIFKKVLDDLANVDKTVLASEIRREFAEKEFTNNPEMKRAFEVIIGARKTQLKSDPTLADTYDEFVDGIEKGDVQNYFTEWPEAYNLLKEKLKTDPNFINKHKGDVEDFIKKNRKGKPIGEKQKNRFKQLFSELKEPWKVWVMKIDQALNMKRTDKELKIRWAEAFDDAVKQFTTNSANGDYSLKILTDRFLETGRYQQDMMWSKILSNAKTDMLSKYPEKQDVVNRIFNEMEGVDTEEGLKFIIDNAEKTEPEILAFRQKYKQWLWEFKTPPKSLEDGASLWDRFFSSTGGQLIKKLLRIVLLGTSYTPNQYRIMLAKKGYTKYAAMQLEFMRFLNLRVLLPMTAAALYYLAYAGDEVGGGLLRIITYPGWFGDWTNSPVEINYLNDYVWKPIMRANMSWTNLFDGEDKGWLWFLTGILPGDLDLLILSTISSTKSQKEELGRWKFKDKKTDKMVTDKEGNEVEFKDLESAVDFYAESRFNKKVYICDSPNNGDCARLLAEYTKRKKADYQKLLKDQAKKTREGIQNLKTLFKEADVVTAQLSLVTIEKKLQESEGTGVATDIANTIRPYFLFIEGDNVIAYTKDFKKIIFHKPNDGVIYGLDENGNQYGIDKNGNEYPAGSLSDFGKYVYKKVTDKQMIDKSTILPVKEHITQSIKKLIKEMNEGKKFGEDNFKHWKDTFKFKKYDEKTNQLKDVKITAKMDEIMDRIDHFRKKYDEDDSFVRAVIDVYGTGIDIIQYTKGLAHLTEGVIVGGLLGVLSTIRESKELVTWTVKHYKDGNWELVKGNFNKKELLNVGKTKRERDERQKESDNPVEGLKKKEQESIMILNRDEKEGLNGLPTKVKQKVKEKLRQGWTTEKPFDFLNTYYSESEINSVFNDKIKIYKLKPSAEFFRTLAKNSSKVTVKKGFCKSVKNAKGEYDLSEREKNTLNHFISKCESKFGV